MVNRNNIDVVNSFNKDVSDKFDKLTRDLIIVQDRIYLQLESLSWLQRELLNNVSLPPLRGWASSPDVLLRLHRHIIANKPKVVVELGSGVSTLVIADALIQNGVGQLFSIEHDNKYGSETLSLLEHNRLKSRVKLLVKELEPWIGDHLNDDLMNEPSLWYSVPLFDDIYDIDLLWVDGPPASTCLYSRYPALPVLYSKSSKKFEVWMDDTIRKEERLICEKWSEDYNLNLQYYPLEKGLGRLRSVF